MTSKKKERADVLLVRLGLAETQAKAASLIMAGNVLLGTKRIDKAGETLPSDAVLTLKEPPHPWVSRGGLKLVKGLKVLEMSVSGFICLDIGSSTGGFTDVLLTNGAEKVYAVDVGYGILAEKLRQNPKVVLLERTNARHLTEEQIKDPIDLLVCDASFIGLRTVLPAPMEFVRENGYMIALVKPQFEAEKRFLANGIVTDENVRKDVCESLSDWVNAHGSWKVLNIVESPITGAEGNVEYLLIARKTPS